MSNKMKSNVVLDKDTSETPSVEEMREALEQYYEAAGFTDVDSRVLREKNDSEIQKLYTEIYSS